MVDGDLLLQALRSGQVVWRRHALERMLQRDISRSEVRDVLLHGEQIETYASDLPFPSALFAATIRSRALLVVAAVDRSGPVAYVISVYEPDAEHFEADRRTRRRSR